MVMKCHGNVRGEVRVNFLALLPALKLSGTVRADVRLNIAIPMVFWSLKHANVSSFRLSFQGNIWM